MDSIEIWGTVVLTIMKTLTIVSGIGGGGIVVPMIMIFYNMDTGGAVAISGFAMLVGSIQRYISTLGDKHPHKEATCIEYGVANLMLPTVLVGSIIGVFVNKIVPEIILQIMLAIVLALLAFMSGIKAKSIYK